VGRDVQIGLSAAVDELIESAPILLHRICRLMADIVEKVPKYRAPIFLL
jgi:hypothetical protein